LAIAHRRLSNPSQLDLLQDSVAALEQLRVVRKMGFLVKLGDAHCRGSVGRS
jgi:hypothetical protein